MSDNKSLRLKPPTTLPQGPVSKVAFKVFVNQLKAYLEQDYQNYLFLPEGCYQTWGPELEGRRLQALSDDDPENQKLVQQAGAGRDNRFDLAAEQNRLLLTRNSQLSKFITLIAILCHYTEQDDISNCSTSFNWILDYLRQHYNIESRGEHILDIVNVVYSGDISYQTFYKQFRAGFIDNLRKRGDRLAYKGNVQLNADETMGPTLEAAIVLWALERIDPRLPKKVKQNYGHQMVGDTCLVTLQPTIFQNIGVMLSEMEDVDNATAARCNTQQGECNILATHRPKAPPLSRRGQSSAHRGGRRNYQKPSQRKNFCQICYHAGASSNVYLSHSISTCSFLTKADRADLRGIQIGDTSEEQNTGAARWQSYRVPGWDLDTDSDDYDQDEPEINSESYVLSSLFPTNIYPRSSQLNKITPIPSQVMFAQSPTGLLPITLDSGATLSFIREDLVIKLQLPVQPNDQLATLADQKTFISAIGEIEAHLVFQGVPITLRALVVKDLQAPCFGGTNFHVDNKIQTDIANGTIKVRGVEFNQSNAGRVCLPTSTFYQSQQPENAKPTSRSLQVKESQSILPGSLLQIPIQQLPVHDTLAITPSFPGVDPNVWPAQMCSVNGDYVQYKNISDKIIRCPKFSHFRAHDVVAISGNNITASPYRIDHDPPISIEHLLKQIKINRNLMNQEQLQRLEGVHGQYVKVFDSDLTGGY